MTISKSYRAPKGALLGLSNAKTPKGEALGYLTAIMYLAPHTLAGRGTVCASSTPQCRAECLYWAGRGALPTTQQARIARTALFFDNRPAFMTQLFAEITGLEALAQAHGMRLAVRLNGTSDIPWERIKLQLGGDVFPSIMDAFPRVQFYDYTKHVTRATRPNYHLTFSYSGDLEAARKALANGQNVAIVTRHKEAAVDRWPEYMADADSDDARYLDTARLQLLTPKGKMRRAPDGGMLATWQDLSLLERVAREAEYARAAI